MGNPSGVAIGSGWQGIVAYVNLATYYLIGLPIGCVLGFKTSLGVAVSRKNLPLLLFPGFLILCLVLSHDYDIMIAGDLVGYDYWSSSTNCDFDYPNCKNRLECGGNLVFD